MPDTSLVIAIETAVSNMISTAVKAIVFAIVGPTLISMLIQHFLNRRSSVGYSKFDQSVARLHSEREKGDKELHQRLDNHIQTDNEQFRVISDNLSYVRGRIDTALNGRKGNQNNG